MATVRRRDPRLAGLREALRFARGIVAMYAQADDAAARRYGLGAMRVVMKLRLEIERTEARALAARGGAKAKAKATNGGRGR